MSAHSGTHVDAPHHFLNDHRTVDNLRLDVLTGPCLVVDLSDFDGHINSEILEKKKWSHKTPRILFKTKNSARWQAGEKEFFSAFQAVSEDGAKWLVDHGIQLVGVDYLSVAPYKQSGPTHTILLQEGIVVLEGVNLSGVSGGIYELYCLPLKLIGSDGAPARAILVGP
jgi:arylformamidase